MGEKGNKMVGDVVIAQIQEELRMTGEKDM
jgi:hypothetical protein